MKQLSFLLIAFLLSIGAISVSAAIKDDGLILYFSFDQESGGQIKDETGGGNDGNIISNVKIATDKKVHGKGSILFDNPASSVTVDSFNAIEIYQDNTFLFWVNFTQENGGGWNQIIAKKAPGSDRSPGIWTCDRAPLYIHYRYNPNNRGTECAGPNGENTVFDVGTWYHIAGSKQAGTLTFYIDGKKIQSNPVPANHLQGVEKLYIGKTSAYSSARFYLDDLYVYNRALSEEEVSGVMDGDLLPVAPQDKLSTTWGKIKTQRD